MKHSNRLLRRARLSLPSPSGSGRRMSRQELAEAVNAHIYAADQRVTNLNANYLGKLERGEHRWPRADYRRGFRAVLGATTDAELGFYIIKRNGDDAFDLDDEPVNVEAPVLRALPSAVVHREVWRTRLVVPPGTAVIVVPADHPVLLSLVDGKETGA